MSDQKPDVIFLSHQEKICVVVCPQCAAKQSIDISKYVQGENIGEFELVCPECAKKWGLMLERRQHYRKPVRLPGKHYALTDTEKKGEMIVKNISRGGLLLQLERHYNFEKDERLRLEFKLDDQKHSFVQKEVIGRYQNKTMIGGLLVSLVGVAFASPEHSQALAEYFLNCMDHHSSD